MRKLLTFVLGFLTPLALAAQVQYVGLPTQQISSLGTAQEQSNWCWAASAQFVLARYGVPVSQTQVVLRTIGNNYNVGGSDENISSALNYIGPGPNGQLLRLRSSLFKGIPLPNVFFQELGSQRPIYIAFGDNMPGRQNTTGHAVVITAIGYEPGPGGPRLRSVIFHDPSPYAQGTTGGWMELSGQPLDAFLNEIRAYWLVAPY